MLDWIPICPERLSRKSRTLWTGQSVVDPTVLISSIKLDKWEPEYPTLLFRKRRPVSVEWIVFDTYIEHTPESFNIDKWLPDYPDRINVIRRSLWTGISVIDPAPLGIFGETILVEKWIPEYPLFLTRKPSILCSGWTTVDANLSHTIGSVLPPAIEVPPDYKSYIRKWLGDP